MDIKVLDKIVGSFSVKYPNVDFTAEVLGDNTITLGVLFLQVGAKHKVSLPELQQARIDLIEFEFDRLVKEVAKAWFIKSQISIDKELLHG